MLEKFLLALISATALLAEEQAVPASAQALQEWTYSLAIQAASYGSPLVTMYALRDHDALGSAVKAAPNTIWRMEDITTPELSKQVGYVTPNVNVIYGFGFMDLSSEPIILTVPDSKNRYYMVQIVDMWTNAFAYVGGKSTGYQGGTFALVKAGWKGNLPAGARRIDCPTPWILLQPRVHIYVDGQIDLPGARAILQKIQTIGLSAYMGKKAVPTPNYSYPAPQPVNPDLPVSAMQYKDPLQFWDLLMVAMNENPPPADQISALLPMFKPLGIELGKPWDRLKLAPGVIAAMKEAAQKIGPMLANLPTEQVYQGAFIPAPTIGNFGTDYKTRAAVARVGLTANTPYESVYWMYGMDQEGQPLTGEKNYTMTFREGIPYFEPGFWSITMYDAENNYTVSNPINRYMLGSDTHDIKKEADGSFTLIIQKENPGPDKESNWLPSPPGPFYLVPRSYASKPQTIQILSDPKSWPVPAVIPD